MLGAGRVTPPPTLILQVLKIAEFLEPSRALFGVQKGRKEMVSRRRPSG